MEFAPLQSRNSPLAAPYAPDAGSRESGCQLGCINQRIAIVALAVIVTCIWLAPAATTELVFSLLALIVISVAIRAIKCLNEETSAPTTVPRTRYPRFNVPTHPIPFRGSQASRGVVGGDSGNSGNPFARPHLSHQSRGVVRGDSGNSGQPYGIANVAALKRAKVGYKSNLPGNPGQV